MDNNIQKFIFPLEHNDINAWDENDKFIYNRTKIVEALIYCSIVNDKLGITDYLYGRSKRLSATCLIITEQTSRYIYIVKLNGTDIVVKFINMKEQNLNKY